MDVCQELMTKLDSLQKKYEEENQESNLVDTRKYNRASSLGWAFDCQRYLVLKRLYPELEKFTPVQKRRFREGKIQELLMKEEIRAVGIPVEKIDPLVWEKYQIRGEVDDIIQLDGEKYPIDYKSCSAAAFAEVSQASTGQELMKSKYLWIRHYPAQLITYNHLYDKAGGILLFKNKESGEKHPVYVERNDGIMGQILEVINDVNACVAAAALPAAIWCDACKSCGYAETCWKEEERKEKEIKRIEDQDLELLLKQREDCREEHERYEKLDAQIKDILKNYHGEFNIGDFKIKVSKYPKIIYEVPDDLKKQYEKVIEITRSTIKYLGGAL